MTQTAPNPADINVTNKPAANPVKPETIAVYLSQNRMLVMLRIGSNPPVPVVFDTGTNGNLLDLGLADSLKLPNTGPSPSIDGSTGKPVPGHDTFIKDAKLGGVAIADARATALDYNLTDEVGIFGPNSFPGKLVKMDGPRSRLGIFPLTADTIPPGETFSYEGKDDGGLPSAVVEIGGIKVRVILDTGNNSAVILPMDYVQNLPLTLPLKQIGYATSAAGKQPIYSAHLKGSLKIGGLVLDQPEIRFMKGGVPNIGLPILRQLVIVMDPSGHRDWIVSAP